MTAKVRSLAKPVPARLEADRVVFDTPEYGVAPGQAAVLYAGDRVLGGGWIEETERAERSQPEWAHKVTKVATSTREALPPPMA